MKQEQTHQLGLCKADLLTTVAIKENQKPNG
mgnify:CR=1 FL=1